MKFWSSFSNLSDETKSREGEKRSAIRLGAHFSVRQSSQLLLEDQRRTGNEQATSKVQKSGGLTKKDSIENNSATERDAKDVRRRNSSKHEPQRIANGRWRRAHRLG